MQGCEISGFVVGTVEGSLRSRIDGAQRTLEIGAARVVATAKTRYLVQSPQSVETITNSQQNRQYKSQHHGPDAEGHQNGEQQINRVHKPS